MLEQKWIGIIGKDTWRVLNSDFKKPVDSYPGYVIREGSRGENVKKIQERLIELGYSCGRWGADSVFGGETEKAVKKFQRDVGIDADGEVGRITWSRLF